MTAIFTKEMGRADGPVVVMAHGWGRDHTDFVPIAELVAPHARVILVDLPGFGQSPRPEVAWSTADYADALREALAEYGSYVWVGHSFGGRVGLRLAAQKDTPISAMVIAGGAGVKLPQPFAKRMRAKYRGAQFKRLKAGANGEAEIIALEKRFGSPDYVASREAGLRDIFVKTVSEDQSDVARRITIPTHLIYGGKDTETPPGVGRMLHGLIAGSTFLECPELDHHTLLTRGRHQVAGALKDIVTGDAP